MCPSCDNHNYANRQACNKCGTPKPGLQMYAAPMGGVPMQQFGGKGGAQLAGGMPSGFREGDWMCASCGNHNYSSRENCNKCGGPKTPGSGFAAVKGGAPPRPTPYPFAMPQAMPMQPANMRPGDWMCPACGNHNYASREACNKCQQPKPVAPEGGCGGNWREGDWACPSCGNHNY